MISIDSVEFYVIAAVAAAAVIGLCVRPSGKGAARQYLLAGSLEGDASEDDEEPGIDIEVDHDGKVIITRRGLGGMVNSGGAVSLAVTVAGFDISIEERLTPGRTVEGNPSPARASFILDTLGPEHYHLRYYSQALDRLAAAPLHVRTGIRISRPLR